MSVQISGFLKKTLQDLTTLDFSYYMTKVGLREGS